MLHKFLYLYMYMYMYSVFRLVRTRQMVNQAREVQRQEKPWWSSDTDVQIVRYSLESGGERQTEPSHSWFFPTFPSG